MYRVIVFTESEPDGHVYGTFIHWPSLETIDWLLAAAGVPFGSYIVEEV